MSTVNVLGSEKVQRQLRLIAPLLDKEHPNSRQKAYVAVAWTFVREGDIDEALRLLDLLTPDYIQNVMPTQMDEDPSFAQMAEVVANAVVEAGIHRPSYSPPDDAYVLGKARA